jgi:glycosyltransferase involved in cell wall biosynthesis
LLAILQVDYESSIMKISILTPSFNSGKYIERAIQSVVRQEYKNWEHIVVDGESSDNTIKVLKKYSHLHWVSESDQGQSDAMNKAFRMSSGDVIVYLNADDEFTKGSFYHVITEFNDSKTDIVIGNLERVNENGDTKIIYPSLDIYNILKYWPCTFPANPISYFYRRQVQEKIGFFPIDNHYTMDYWFLLRAYHQFNLKKIDIVLGKFHFSRENKSANVARAKASLRRTRNEFIIEQRNLHYIGYLVKNKLYRMIARLH